MTTENPPDADMVPQPTSPVPSTVQPMRGVGAVGETLDELDEFVQDARRAGIPGHSTVWTGSTRGFRLTTSRARGDEPIRTPIAEPEARALIDLIRSSELGSAQGWLFSSDLRAAVIAAELWPDRSEYLIDQTISSVMAELGLTVENLGKRRVLDETGRKVTAFHAEMVRHALHQREATR